MNTVHTLPIPIDLPERPCLPVGATISRSFVAEVSRRCLSELPYRSEPALVALGYWFRAAAVHRWLDQTFPVGRYFVPRGLVFHIPPGNVDTTYAYLWLLSVLVGNQNVVRLSSRTSTVSDLFERLCNEVLALPEYSPIAAMNRLVRFDRESELTAFYSERCDVRVVAGSDATVQSIRRLPLRAEAIELNLVGKSSFVVADVGAVLAADDTQVSLWADGVWRDISGFEQLACNSPRSVWWLGGTASELRVARERFWASFEALISSVVVPWTGAGVVQREGSLDLLGTADQGARVVSPTGSAVTRVWLETAEWPAEWFGGSGVLFETAVGDLDALRPRLSRQQQTVASLGVSHERWQSFLTSLPLGGIDRVVPVGQSLSFDHVWDGFDLGRVFTREITLTA